MKPDESFEPLVVANVLEDGRFSGPHNRILTVAPYMDERGISSILVGPFGDDIIMSKRVADVPVELETVEITSLHRGIRGVTEYLLSLPSDVRKICDVLRDRGANIVHCNGAWQIKAALAGVLSSAKTVLHLNDAGESLLVRWAAGIIAYCCADGVIYASKSTRAVYRSLVPTRLPSAVIQAPVDTRRFQPKSNPVGVRKSFAEKSVVVTVCTINPDKDIVTWIRVAKCVQEECGAETSFLLVGPVYSTQVEYFSRVEELAESMKVKNWSHLGPVDDPHRIIAESDLYLCTSQREASPTVVWEAMATGLPIVSTDVADVSDYLGDGRGGLVRPIGDYEGLAEATCALLDDHRRRTRMGRRNVEVARRCLSAQTVAASYLEFYSSVVP